MVMNKYIYIVLLSVVYHMSPVFADSPVITHKQSNYLGTDKPCRNGDGQDIFNQSCNAYLSSLAKQCETDKIFDTQTAACVSTLTYKMPLIGCEYEIKCSDYIAYPGYSAYQYTSYKDLVAIKGNRNSNTIVIFAQGGPMNKLLTNYVSFLHDDFMVVYVAQTNTLKSNILKSYDISVLEADRENEESISILHTVYLGVKRDFPNKNIVLAGHSMGSFLVLRYLENYGNPFDKVLHMGGRFKIDNQEFLNDFILGKDLLFSNYIGNFKDYIASNSDTENLEVINTTLVSKQFEPSPDPKILASLGRHDSLAGLATVDLTNLVVLYSSKDEQLDGLSQEEQRFLDNKGAVYEDVGWHPQALGHSLMLFHPKQIKHIISILSAIVDPTN